MREFTTLNVDRPAAAVAPAAAPTAESSTAGAKKPKPRFTMRDDGGEVEVTLPLPPEVVSKKELAVTTTSTSLTVRAGTRQLLHVSPLVSEVHTDVTWTLDKDRTGQLFALITLEKVREAVEWTGSLAAQGGVFTCWTTELDD